MLFILVACIVTTIWNRFVLPKLMAVGVSMLLGEGQLGVDEYSNSNSLERIVVYAKVVVSVMFFAVSPLRLLMALFVLLIDILEFVVALVAVKGGRQPYSWLYRLSRRDNVNNGYSGTNNIRTANGNIRSRNINQNTQFNYGGNLQNRSSAGTLNGEQNWLIQGSKKLYINNQGVITYNDRREGTREIRGIRIYERGDVIIYAFDVREGCENVINRMSEKPAYCDLNVFSGSRLSGYFYFISNRGEVIADIFHSYQNCAISNNTSIRVIDNRRVLVSKVDDISVLLSLDVKNDILECQLRSDYKIDIVPAKVIDAGNTLIYQFNRETLEPVRPVENKIIQNNDFQGQQDVPSQQSSLEIDLSEQTQPSSSTETSLLTRSPDGKYKGVAAWRVKGFPNTLILENGHLLVKVNGSPYEFTNDGEVIINEMKCYKFEFENDKKEVTKFLFSKYKEICNTGASDDLDEFLIVVSKCGDVVGNYKFESVSDDTEEKIEAITMQDLRNSYTNVVSKFKVLKLDASEVKRRVINRGMIYDGVYNTGHTDLMCQFGELRCCYYMEFIPVLQCMFVGKLVAQYAINNIIDRISDEWNQDVSMDKFYDIIMDDIESLVGQKDNAVINTWLVKDDDAYYVSIVLNFKDDSVTQVIQYVKQYLLEVFSTTARIKREDEVCFISNIVDADSDKLVLDSGYTDLNGSGASSKHYYSLNLLDSTPQVFNKYVSGLDEAGVKNLKSAFNELGVLFKLRYPMIAACRSNAIEMIKFQADVNMLSNLDGTNKCSTIDLTGKGTSVSKICDYIDKKILKSNASNRVIKSWYKNLFVVRARVADGFIFSFIRLYDDFLVSGKTLYDTREVPVFALAFWSNNGESVIDDDLSEVVLYMFKKGG